MPPKGCRQLRIRPSTLETLLRAATRNEDSHAGDRNAFGRLAA
jgi:hypothetical protein